LPCCSSLWAAAGQPDLVSSKPVGASASLGIADRDPTAEATTDLFQLRSRPPGPPPAPVLNPADAKTRRARRIAPRFQISGVGRGGLSSGAGPRR